MPSAWSAAARLAVTVDLPTPPLPEPTQITFFTRASAPCGSAPRPRRCWSVCFSESVSTSKSTVTAVTPSRAPTCSATASWKCERIGQPGVVSDTRTCTRPPSPCSIARTIPSSTMSLRSSGSMTLRERVADLFLGRHLESVADGTAQKETHGAPKAPRVEGGEILLTADEELRSAVSSRARSLQTARG